MENANHDTEDVENINNESEINTSQQQLLQSQLQSNMNNYFSNMQNIDVQNVVNAVNSALAGDFGNDELTDEAGQFHINIDPSIQQSHNNNNNHVKDSENKLDPQLSLYDSRNKIILSQDNRNVSSHTQKSGQAVARISGESGHQAINNNHKVKESKFEVGGDPKKTCPFCNASFSHPGSLGRHLDLKKGTDKHPLDEISKLRANVKRRGDQEVVKKRRKLRSKEYNSRQDVKERNRIRRRLKDRQLKAKDMSQSNFLSRLGTPSLQPHPTFARLVLYFLPPNQWPHDPPTMETYRLLNKLLSPSPIYAKSQQGESIVYSDYVAKLEAAFENWLSLNHEQKTEIWNREQRRTAEDALGSLSLFDLATRDLWMQDEERRHYEVLVRDQNLNSPISPGRGRDDDDDGSEGEDEDDYYDGHRNDNEADNDDESTSVAFAAVAAAVAHGQMQ